MEMFYWWAPSVNPKADNRRVLEDYSARYRRNLSAGGHVRTTRSGSGQTDPGLRYAVDNGGRIPFNAIECGSEGPRSAYMRYCKARGLPPHPARMPEAMVVRHVRLLTEEGDLVMDPFAGSLTVAAVCRRLGRRVIAAEKVLQYLEGGVGGRLNFDQSCVAFPATSPAHAA
jgi:site-specific DNA-methyltransferase (cytosine-N4-specific)